MNRTIIDSCTQKRDRRAKSSQESRDDDFYTKGKSSLARRKRVGDDVLNKHQLKKQIKQKITVTQVEVTTSNARSIAYPIKESKYRTLDNAVIPELMPQEYIQNIEASIQPLDEPTVVEQQLTPIVAESMLVEEGSTTIVNVQEPAKLRQDDETRSELTTHTFTFEFSVEGNMSRGLFTDGETASANCQSESINTASCIYTLEEHLSNLADNLSQVLKCHHYCDKELIYKGTHRFIKNFQRFELHVDLIVRKKVGKYLSIIFTLLKEINDKENNTYSSLLVDATALVSRVKRQLLEFVRFTCDRSTKWARKGL